MPGISSETYLSPAAFAESTCSREAVWPTCPLRYYDGRQDGPPRNLERTVAHPVSRLGRLLDLAGLALLLVGAICFGYAHAGMRGLQAAGFVPRKAGEPFGAVVQWEQWRRLAHVGVLAVIVGVAVGVAAAIVHIRQRRAVAQGES